MSHCKTEASSPLRTLSSTPGQWVASVWDAAEALLRGSEAETNVLKQSEREKGLTGSQAEGQWESTRAQAIPSFKKKKKKKTALWRKSWVSKQVLSLLKIQGQAVPTSSMLFQKDEKTGGLSTQP